MSRVILLDDGCGQFGPMTDLRASFELRTGAFTTGRRIAKAYGELSGALVPDELVELASERMTVPVNHAIPSGDALFINGRLILPGSVVCPALGEAVIEADSGAVIAAHLDAADAAAFIANRSVSSSVNCSELPAGTLAEFPWHILDHLPAALLHDIETSRHPDPLMVPEAQIMGSHPVKAHATCEVGTGAVFDTRQGPVLLWDHVEIGPNAVICGPASIGPHSFVQAQSLIKANTAIGPHCKVGGEVGSTIFQGYANKVHDGHLGDSWVGHWANLGAGTHNSNLLNTYDDVTAVLRPGDARHRTNRQFFGTILGDHVKLAIGTRVMTGAVIGMGAMIATSAPVSGAIGAFEWITDGGRHRYRPQKFIKVARAVMERRQVKMTAAYETALLRHLEQAQDSTVS